MFRVFFRTFFPYGDGAIVVALYTSKAGPAALIPWAGPTGCSFPVRLDRVSAASVNVI